jgi:hypothetical protein
VRDLQKLISGGPKLAQISGQALFSLGGFLIIYGVIGRAGLRADGTPARRASSA